MKEKHGAKYPFFHDWIFEDICIAWVGNETRCSIFDDLTFIFRNSRHH